MLRRGASPPFPRRWRGMLDCLLLLGIPFLVDGIVPEGKETPEKGDVQCPSLAERYDDFRNGGDGSLWLTPCNEEGTNVDAIKDIPSHGLILELFTSLPAYGRDYQNLISSVMIGYLDEAALEYKVESNVTYLNLPADLFNYTERRNNPTYEAGIFFQTVVARPIYSLDASVWYQYEFVFNCFYGNAYPTKMGEPIVDTNELRRIRQQLNHYLREGIALVNEIFDFAPRSCGLLGLAIEDPRYAAEPFQDGPPTLAPTEAPTAMPMALSDDALRTASPATGELPPRPGTSKGAPPLDTNYITYTLPMDVEFWDWRRYLGLALFVSTAVGTLLLTQWAARRRRHITTRHVWGNLGTEQGVDALLSTGWKVRGSKMEVFNKEKEGYRDDDSMLLGGFEPTAYLGAEITVTQDSRSGTTPDG